MSGYEDMMDLPYPRKPRRMSNYARGAQFAPFAALTGFGAAIVETARLTDGKIELDENEKFLLNEKLLEIGERIDERPEIAVTYFRPDLRKEGGAYVQKRGRVKKLDPYSRAVCFADGTAISIEDILAVFLD